MDRKIKNIGGELARAYIALEREVEYINRVYSPLWNILGLNDPSDKDVIIEGLRYGAFRLSDLYTNRVIEKAKAGEITIPSPRDPNNPITKECQKLRFTKEGEKITDKAVITRRARASFRKKLKEFLTDYNLRQFNPLCNTKIIYFSKEVLRLTDGGRLSIDDNSFIDFYQSFIKAEESETYQSHRKAAEALNTFFGGKEITIGEIERYFTFSNGIAEINPESVNVNSYSRLGIHKKNFTKK